MKILTFPIKEKEAKKLENISTYKTSTQLLTEAFETLKVYGDQKKC